MVPGKHNVYLCDILSWSLSTLTPGTSFHMHSLILKNNLTVIRHNEKGGDVWSLIFLSGTLSWSLSILILCTSVPMHSLILKSNNDCYQTQ